MVILYNDRNWKQNVLMWYIHRNASIYSYQDSNFFHEFIYVVMLTFYWLLSAHEMHMIERLQF